MPRRLTVLPFLASTFYILSFPKFSCSILAWVALTPLVFFALQSSPRRAFLGGWAAGTLAYMGILYWIVVTFQAAHLSPALGISCLLLLAAYLGLYWGAWSLALSYYVCRPVRTEQCSATFEQVESSVLVVFGAAAWVALEYLRTYLFSGFPWTLLGDSQFQNLPIAQVASVTGVYGVSFLVAMANTALAIPRRRSIATTVFVILTVYVGGAFRLHHPDTQAPRDPLKVALLQGSIDQYKKWDKAYVQDIQRIFEALNEQASRQKPDLIIWPETSVPGYLLQDPPLRTWLEQVVRRTHTYHLIGAPVLHSEKAYNSSFLMDYEGNLEGEYAKHHLVPFGEVVPWANVLGRWIRVLNDLGGFSAGQGSSVLMAANHPIGVNICYEAIFPNLVRQSVKDGAQLIANLTNDGWYMRTAAPYQHLIPNIFRAIENDRWVMRADNTGVSALIDPLGRIQAASPIFQRLVIQGTVESRTTRTFYTRFGDLFACLCCLFCVLIYLRAILRP